MSRLITAGFDWQALGSQGADGVDHFDYIDNDGGYVYTAGRVSGYALRLGPGGGDIPTFSRWGSPGNGPAFVAGRGYALRCYVRFSAWPTSMPTIIELGFAGVFIDTAGQMGLNNASGLSDPVALNTWLCIEVAIRIADPGDPHPTKGYMGLRIDGTTVSEANCISSADSYSATSQPINPGGSWPGGATIDIDDVALNDTTGSWQNTWPGPGEIHLLRPTSDSSGGNWRVGSSYSKVVTNLYDQVNNEPPTGTGNPIGPPVGPTIPNSSYEVTGTITSVGARGGTKVGSAEVVPDDCVLNLESFTGSGTIDVIAPHAGVAQNNEYGTFSESLDGPENNVDARVSAGGNDSEFNPVTWQTFNPPTGNYAHFRQIGQSFPASSAPSTVTISKRTHTIHTALSANAVGVYVESGHVDQDPIPDVACARLMCVL